MAKPLFLRRGEGSRDPGTNRTYPMPEVNGRHYGYSFSCELNALMTQIDSQETYPY